MDLHGQIMNIECQKVPPFPFTAGPGATDQLRAYKEGHRDARHAAAELALSADATIDALRKRIAELEADAERYRWLRDDAGAISVFTAAYWNTNTAADLDAAIDAARA